jgi:hypothetical protein
VELAIIHATLLPHGPQQEAAVSIC